MHIRESAATLLAAGTMVAAALAGAPSASATSNSGYATYPNGVRLTANMWIQSFSWTGCGSFSSSAVIGASPNWIRNATDFYQIGLGSLSVKGLNIGSSRVDSNSLVWTNYNGAKGSYLSGSVCGGWGAVYVGADVYGTAFYYGNVRQAHARV